MEKAKNKPELSDDDSNEYDEEDYDTESKSQDSSSDQGKQYLDNLNLLMHNPDLKNMIDGTK